MKKIAAGAVSLCLAFLIGCGTVSGLSEGYVNAAEKAIEIGEQYLSMELSADEAYDQISEIQERLENMEPYDDSADLSADEIEDAYRKGSSVSLSIDLLSANILWKDDDGVRDAIDNIKDDLG